MRARLSQIRGLMLRRIRYKVTRGGVLFTAALIMVALAAIASANNLLFLILATMLSTLMVSGLVSRLCLAGLELDFLVPEHVSARRTIAARLYVRNSKFWMPSFSIHVVGVDQDVPSVLQSAVYFPVIPGGAILEESVQVRFAHRGAYRQNRFAFHTRFPFGFLEKTARVVLRREVIIYPCIDAQSGFEDLLADLTGEIETHYRGLGRDFYRIRPYAAFESARHVDWKATAHTGDLQVREFAREQEQTVELFLDLEVPPGSEAWFESAVDCCAFIAWRLAGKAVGIHLRTQEFDFRLPEEGDIYTILKYLALVTTRPGKPPEAPADETSFPIVLTASPQRFGDPRWAPARIISPDLLPCPGGSEDDINPGGGTGKSESASEDQHHRGGKGRS
ncbi:MAG: DUF58 domain-containing protein [Bryobacteraceae bacterium]